MDDAAENHAPDNHFPTLQSLGDAVGYVDRILAIIERIRLIDGFERADIETLARYMRCYRAEEGIEIIREGELGEYMLLLLEGSVEILKRNAQGLPQRLSVAHPGKVLGEMSLIDGEPRFSSCITLEPTLFAVLDRQSLTRLVAESPRIAVKLLMELLIMLNQRLRNVSSELMRCIDTQKNPLGC